MRWSRWVYRVSLSVSKKSRRIITAYDKITVLLIKDEL